MSTGSSSHSSRVQYHGTRCMLRQQISSIVIITPLAPLSFPPACIPMPPSPPQVRWSLLMSATAPKRTPPSLCPPPPSSSSPHPPRLLASSKSSQPTCPAAHPHLESGTRCPRADGKGPGNAAAAAAAAMFTPALEANAQAGMEGRRQRAPTTKTRSTCQGGSSESVW